MTRQPVEPRPRGRNAFGRNLCRSLLAAVSMAATLSHAQTQLVFALDGSYTTSAAIYDADGRLVRTLSRGEPRSAGGQTLTWDNRDDAGNLVPAGNYAARVLRHQIRYSWEGVVGNSSSVFTGPGIHRAFLPPQGLAIAGGNLYMAVGYNEQQSGMQGLRLASPQVKAQPFNRPDPFTAFTMVATDGARLYWVNRGGLSAANFVIATTATLDPAAASFHIFAAGRQVCLNYFPNSSTCYPGQDYPSVIDDSSDPAAVPTGIAVQASGPVLAVAHGTQGVVKLYDKVSGALLRTITIPVGPARINQLAMSPDGDLWVIVGSTARRYRNLATAPLLAATITGLQNPLAVAVQPTNANRVLVADGGASQQVKAYNRDGGALWTYGVAGGYGGSPAADTGRLWFRYDGASEQTALAVQDDGSFWVLDTANNRMLHVSATRRYLAQVAYVPASYCATADLGNPTRVFSNFLEFAVDTTRPLQPGQGSWRLVRNWLAAFPRQDASAYNYQWGGLHTVVTLGNGRTYAVSSTNGATRLFELPATGAARDTGITLEAACPGAVAKCVLYENGDLGWAAGDFGSKDTRINADPVQRVWRARLDGFDAAGNPRWAAPTLLASIGTQPTAAPYYHGAFTGPVGARFPQTPSGRVVFFDPSVAENAVTYGNEGFHLGAVATGQSQWLWQASPTGVIDGKGSYQTRAVDRTMQYGGNLVWANGSHVLFGFHGEFYTELATGRVGQANQTMHFLEDGLFVGQFGVPLLVTGAPQDPGTGQAGNAFANALVPAGPDAMYWVHNDESNHGGVHRWRIDKLGSASVLTGSGPLNGTIVVR